MNYFLNPIETIANSKKTTSQVNMKKNTTTHYSFISQNTNAVSQTLRSAELMSNTMLYTYFGYKKIVKSDAIMGTGSSARTAGAVKNSKDQMSPSPKTRTLISQPVFSYTPSKVTIEVFYYHRVRSPRIMGTNKFTTLGSNKLDVTKIQDLNTCLGLIFEKEVNLVMTQLHYPYLNSSIFAQFLANNSRSNTFMHFKNAILTYPSFNISDLPSHVAGIKIRVSGRLITERAIPRKTSKVFLLGSFNGVGNIIDYSEYTGKNELGAFTIKVWIAQRSK